MKSLLFASLALVAPLAGFAARIVGSDLAGPAVTPNLTAPAVGAETDFRGSFDALRDLRAGRADAALIFIREGEKVPEIESGEWVAAPVAYQPVYVVVHRANKASDIDLATLAGLFGKTTDTKFDTWRCLPASGLTQGPIALASNPGKGLTVSHFRAEVLAGAEYRPSVRFAASDADAEARALTTVNAVVLLSREPESGSLKVLAVADGRPGKTARAYMPNASNLRSGDYPLRVTLFAVYPKAKKTGAASAVKTLLSEDVAKILIAKGLLPSSENIRNKFTEALDS